MFSEENIMRQVIALELVGLKKLDCDLYNENGKLIYKKGTEFTPEIFMMLNHTKIFKKEEEVLSKERDQQETTNRQKNTNRQINDEQSDSQKQKRDGFNELQEKELGQQSSRDGFNELFEKELMNAKKKALNELEKLNITDPRKKRLGFNELYAKELLKQGKPLDVIEKELKKINQVKEKAEKAQDTNIANMQEGVRSSKPKNPQTKQAIEKAVNSIKQLEPKNVAVEFKSVFEEESKQVLLEGIQEVLYGAINQAPTSINPCVTATEHILNEVYTKLKDVNNFNELRVHDYYTFAHSLNVAIISAIIGKEMGYNEHRLKDLTFSAFLHDVGKMQIPKEVLYKPGRLNAEELELIKKHAEKGYNFLIEHLNLPPEMAKPALEHHERWEGHGYPRGLKGNQISEFSQIVAIADVYDALLSEKVYKGSIQSIDAMRVLLNEETGSFNPKILNKFVYLGVVNTGLPI